MRDKLAMAVEHRKAERYDEARQILEELYKATPNDPIVNYQYAWLHDRMGDERGAVPFYERAIQQGLAGEDLQGALLGLGSTYRCLGEYDKSVETLRRGMTEFPDAREFPTFLAMALYNTGKHAEAMELLLLTLVETSSDEGIKGFEEAIRFYADKLDETWP